MLVNPMEDLVGQHQPWAHEVFHHYRRRLGRQYGSARELEHRQSVFVHNMRYRQLGGVLTPPSRGVPHPWGLAPLLLR